MGSIFLKKIERRHQDGIIYLSMKKLEAILWSITDINPTESIDEVMPIFTIK
jgi:hypothetical protein